MTNDSHPRGRIRRLFGHSLLTGAGVLAAPEAVDAANIADDAALESTVDLDDPTTVGPVLATAIAHMSGFDATSAAATAALSPNVRVRRALAEALVTPFPLVGDDFVLDQLLRDTDDDVRDIAARACRARGLEPRRVLVIDDFAVGRAALCAYISEIGYEAIGASSGIVNLDVAWPDHVDMVVAHDDPPWTDGPQVVAQLRRHAPDLPMIVMTRPIVVDDLARAIDALVPPKPRT